MTISNTDFTYIRDLIRQRAAIILEPGKEYLVESRLLPVARQEGLTSLAELIARLRTQPYNGLHHKVVEAMTTNETSFFRDVHPFEALKKVIVPELITKRATGRTLNLWCGAASSGQEPYTVALVLREHFPALAQWNVRFMATDLSHKMLVRAQAGKYSQLEVNRGLPAPLLVKHFTKHGLEWHVKDDLRKMIEFRQLNLIDAWPVMPAMDIVFLRNVLIYFNVDTKKMILGKIRQLLQPDGYLFLGGAETTMGLDDAFERVQIEKASCYRLCTQ
jgi:chemotaxis protein methyltransferase CheR